MFPTDIQPDDPSEKVQDVDWVASNLNPPELALLTLMYFPFASSRLYWFVPPVDVKVTATASLGMLVISVAVAVAEVLVVCKWPFEIVPLYNL